MLFEQKMEKFIIFLTIAIFGALIVVQVDCVPSLFYTESQNFEEIHGIWGKSNDEDEGELKLRYRLPESVVPLRYQLEIRPILDDDPSVGTRFTAPGTVRILVNSTVDTNSIVLHSLNVVVNNITVTNTVDLTNIPVTSITPNATNEIITIALGNPGLAIGRLYEIFIDFVCPIPEGRVDGLYLTSYTAANGEKRYIATTHLEPDDCRRIFPTFDEPSFKANWSVSIIRKKSYHSLANQAIERTEPIPSEPEWERDVYEELVGMSSYILAFVVSDYTSETANSSLFDKPVRVWGPPPLMEEGAGKYAPDISAQFLEFFESKFNYTYQLSKMDEIAFPDFAIGAMENWGLNTYRESRLLYVEGISTIDDKIKMTSTISHELSHQWFGNLITPKWWNDSWLKEGFASYLAALGVNDVFPEHLGLDSLVTNSVQLAMQVDAGPNTHALSPPAESIGTGPQISAHFSTITYNKGASICRMMNGFLTEEVFINGLSKYLKEFAFQNVNKDELFTILHQEAIPATLPPGGVTVNTIMDTWVTQSGFPIVTATRATATPTLIKLTQNKYGGNPAPPVSWWIPIALVSKGYDTTEPDTWTTTVEWLHSTDIDHAVTFQGTDWYLVNPTMIGNYRVLYDNDNLGLIIAQLLEDHSKIDPLSRSALLDDYFNLAFTNQGVQIDRSLELTKYMSNERHLVPWVTFFTNMAQSYRMLSRSAVFLNYRNYLLGLIEPALEEIKMIPQPGEGIGATVLLRNRLVEWACNLGSQPCINFAKESVANWMTMENATRNNPINPDLRPTLYCTAMAHGGDEVWDFFVARYTDAHLATSSKYLPDMARISLVRALACSKQSYRLAKLLELVLDNESFLRPEHRLTAIQAVAGNSAGVDLTLNFIRNEFDTIIRRRGASMFSSTVATLSNYMNTELAYSDLNAFILSKEEELAAVRSSLNSSLANIQRNIGWISDHLERIKTFMDANTNTVNKISDS